MINFNFKSLKRKGQVSIDFLLIFSVFLMLMFVTVQQSYRQLDREKEKTFGLYAKEYMDKTQIKVNNVLRGSIGDKTSVNFVFPVQSEYDQIVIKETKIKPSPDSDQLDALVIELRKINDIGEEEIIEENRILNDAIVTVEGNVDIEIEGEEETEIIFDESNFSLQLEKQLDDDTTVIKVGKEGE